MLGTDGQHSAARVSDSRRNVLENHTQQTLLPGWPWPRRADYLSLSGTPHPRSGKTQATTSIVVTAGAGDAAAGPDKEAALLESWKAYKTGFQQGIALFNKKPKKGIAFMQEQVRRLRASLCSHFLQNAHTRCLPMMPLWPHGAPSGGQRPPVPAALPRLAKVCSPLWLS